MKDFPQATLIDKIFETNTCNVMTLFTSKVEQLPSALALPVLGQHRFGGIKEC